MTNQPIWQELYSTDYSALFIDTTGVYDAQLMIAQEYETRRGATRWQVYRFDLDRCYIATNDDGSTFLTSMDPSRSDLPYPLATYVPWFRDDLGAIARSCGNTAEELTALLCSDDPKDLANAYEMIGGYHGYDNLGGYPEDWNESMMSAWPERGRMKIKIETNDDDDGHVLLVCDDQQAAKDDQTVDGSRWERPRDMDIAYASVSDDPGLLARLEKDYEVDSSEYSPPTAEDLARWHANTTNAHG